MVLLKVVGDDGMCEGVRRRRGTERLVEIPIYHNMSVINRSEEE